MNNFLKGVKNGDVQVLKEIYEKTVNKAYYTALKYVKNDEVAQDMIQDAFVSVYENLDKFDGANLQSWVNTITANKCKDYLKKRNPVLFTDMASEEGEYIPDIVDDDIDFSPEKAVDYSETKRLMTDILNTLPEEQSLCITMFYYQEMSVKEIAEYFECSENTIKSRLNYARKTIKDKVLELEKSGTKLYLVPVFAFLTWMFATDSSDTVFAQSVSSQTMWNAVEQKTKEKINLKIDGSHKSRQVIKKAAEESGKQTLKWSAMSGATKAAIVITGVAVAAGAVGGAIKVVNLRSEKAEIISEQWTSNEPEIEEEEIYTDPIETEQQLEESTEATVELNEESISAYIEFLRNKEELLKYELGTVDDVDNMYSRLSINLFDMDSNGIPELFIQYEGSSSYLSKVTAFTYNDGTIIKLGNVGAYRMPYFMDNGYVMSCDAHMGTQMIVYQLDNLELSVEKKFFDDFGYSEERFYIDDVVSNKETYQKELKNYTPKILAYGEDVNLNELIQKSDDEFKTSLINMVQDKNKVEHDSNAAGDIEQSVEASF